MYLCGEPCTVKRYFCGLWAAATLKLWHSFGTAIGNKVGHDVELASAELLQDTCNASQLPCSLVIKMYVEALMDQILPPLWARGQSVTVFAHI